MFIWVTQVMCRLCLLCLMGVFLLGAEAGSFCENAFSCYKEYSQEFNFGSIKSISFFKKYMTEPYRERLKAGEEDYKKMMEEIYPMYTLRFVMVEPRLIDIKSVIFDGVEAEVSIFEYDGFDERLAKVKDFQMEAPGMDNKFAEFIFPIPVHNTFTIHLKKRFIDKLKARDKIKITLITHYDKEFVLETDNFIRKYEF
ncbi:hypothetical protein BHY_1081 (plasmid) [Borrelia nietonii YOR]|uniref:Protein BptA n=1 Tax=Borrelia nietonii YOR TaxID=1293576 RepID=W5SAP7_9SPIR|nr:hypothetical protein [Borrelia nietonii]AHH04032.1 hypothetical protein BHY_1081 [Borrelia nietonii YOR]UPA09861.1 hypothetical protein bhYOR_001171 [Borrelia nietonii YOR]